MTSSRKTVFLCRLQLAAIVFLAFGAASAVIAGESTPAASQGSANSGQSQQNSSQENQQENRPSNSEANTPKNPPTTPPANEDEDVKITPQQARDLFHSVDEILEFDSRQTGLPVKHDVKRRLTSRDEVVSYLTKHVNDEDTKRLRRSELVLKKFGMLPRDFNLETFLVAILREEIAGYYDPKTKTVNLLDWVPIQEQEPVMAHELTHALQDQSVGLQKWMKKGEKDLAEMRREPTPTDIENDEIDNAREAVIEGQAQAMMFQYAIAPTGHTLTDSPVLVESMVEETLSGSPSTKVFNEAPIFMKESLTFPYSYGMEFVVKLMEKGGKEKAFASVLQNPPHTTRQIMQPETYLSDEKIEPLPVPDFKRDFKDYQKFDIGAMGEFDVAVLVEQYAGKPISKRIYPEWRGGYYYAVRSKQNAGSDVTTTGPLGLLYVSRWSSAEKASEFADIYARSLKQRYSKVDPVGESADAPVLQQTAVQQGTSQEESHQEKSHPEKSEPNSEFKINLLKGRHAWITEEGTVVIEEQGDTVLVSESLDAATTAALEKEVFGLIAPAPAAAAK